MLTLHQIDLALAEWKTRLDAVAARLVELRSQPGCEILDTLQLTGITHQRMAPALAALEEVFADYALLCGVVRQATELRAQLPRFLVSPEKLSEIDAVLQGPSVRLPPQTSADLLGGGSAGGITLQQLLDRMNAAFVTARDGLSGLDAAWKNLDAKLAPVAAFLDAHNSEHTELRGRVQALRARVLADPFGATAEFDEQIQSSFTTALANAEKVARQREALRANLAAARQTLGALADLRNQNEQVCAERTEKISGCTAPEPALPLRRIDEWSAWLARIAQQCGENVTDRVCEELENGAAQIRSLKAAEESALARNREPLDLRLELRGRLSALKAKAAARGRVEDGELVRLASRAESLLYARPTPMPEAVSLLSEYDARLSGRQQMERM